MNIPHCINKAFLQETEVWWFAFPISCKEVWIADIASAGNSSSSALSNVRTTGITASSQNCCNQLTALSAFFALGETLAATIASILEHLIQRESGIPFLVTFNFLLSFSSLEPKAISRNAVLASDRSTSWPVGSMSASFGSSSSTYTPLSGFRFFGGGVSRPKPALTYMLLCCKLVGCGFKPLCAPLCFSIAISSCMDLTLSGNFERLLTLSKNSARVLAISLLLDMSTRVDGYHSQIKSQ